MKIPLIIEIAVVVFGLNACVTLFVARNSVLLKQHKAVQYCLIWLLPGVGALVSALFLRSIQEVPLGKPSQLVPSNEDYPGVNLHPPVGDP